MNNEMNLVDLMKLLLKKWWIIGVISVMVGFLAFGYTYYFIPDIYISRGMIYVNNTNIVNLPNVNVPINRTLNLNDMLSSARLAETYIEILKSDTFLTSVAEELGMDITPGKMRSLISIRAKNETEILEVTVRYPRSYEASRIVETILEKSKDEEEGIKKVFRGGSVEIIDKASLPTAPSGPNMFKNFLMGLLMGLILGVVFVVVIDMFDNKLKNDEDIAQIYGYPVLGLIPGFKVIIKRRIPHITKI
ncbi:MAG: Capsular polysaccharide type 8 biosynthesis protein cap8A [Firmicutes bacterium ADurb.Bin193]|nr:MAG: Capsular polysaccharide type 8 biosynthesis protein cap8A [Firmicutes bacterium ADurb.Bin193]